MAAASLTLTYVHPSTHPRPRPRPLQLSDAAVDLHCVALCRPTFPSPRNNGHPNWRRASWHDSIRRCVFREADKLSEGLSCTVISVQSGFLPVSVLALGVGSWGTKNSLSAALWISSRLWRSALCPVRDLWRTADQIRGRDWLVKQLKS